MGRTNLRKWRSLLLAFFLASGSMGGTERCWIVREAQLIVVGTLRIRLTYPWLDGWHITGSIAVEQVLFGPRRDPQIDYEYVCRWAQRILARAQPEQPNQNKGALVSAPRRKNTLAALAGHRLSRS